MNKKITIFLIITIIIISIFCISVFADYTIPEGTVITFNSTVNLNGLENGNYNLKFKDGFHSTSYTYFIKSSTQIEGKPSTTTIYSTSWTNPWSGVNANKWTILDDSTISDELITWIVNNSDYEIPPPPPDPMETVYDNGQNFLSNTHQNINTIIGFITRNPIITVFTIGIFLISITVGILYRLNNKNTKRKS